MSPEAPARSCWRNATCELGEVLVLMERCACAQDTAAAVDLILDEARARGALWPERSAETATRSIAWLRSDSEPIDGIVHERIFPSMVGAAAARHPDTESAVRAMADDYVRATRHLLPLVLAFVDAATALVAGWREPRALLLLRDCFCFLPAMRVVVPPEAIDLVLFTRRQQSERAPPRVLGSVGPERDLETLSGLLIDIGLYGSLINELIVAGRCPRDRFGVLFVASRNPYIAGWLNMQLAARWARGEKIDLLHSIRALEALETLLKPFCLSRPGAGSTPTVVELADPFSLACAAAYDQALRRAAVERSPDGPDWYSLLDGAMGRDDLWWLDPPVPRWEGAERLIGGWSHGLIAPMDRLSGWDL